MIACVFKSSGMVANSFPLPSNNLIIQRTKKFYFSILVRLSTKRINDSMLIGNRQRSQMQRTTSVTRITVEVHDHQTAGQDSDVAMAVVDGGDNYDQRFLGMFSPRNHRSERKDDGRSSLSSSSFLGNCGFCKSRLAPGRDIYMYKYV